MYAVIETGGKQYRVRKGQLLRIERLDAEVGGQVEFDRILALGEGADLTLGTPYVQGGKVIADVIDQSRAKKIHIIKFLRRKNHLRMKGHRQYYTEVKIKDIQTA